jgi:hypothetical protein
MRLTLTPIAVSLVFALPPKGLQKASVTFKNDQKRSKTFKNVKKQRDSRLPSLTSEGCTGLGAIEKAILRFKNRPKPSKSVFSGVFWKDLRAGRRT